MDKLIWCASNRYAGSEWLWIIADYKFAKIDKWPKGHSIPVEFMPYTMSPISISNCSITTKLVYICLYSLLKSKRKQFNPQQNRHLGQKLESINIFFSILLTAFVNLKRFSYKYIFILFEPSKIAAVKNRAAIRRLHCFGRCPGLSDWCG